MLFLCLESNTCPSHLFSCPSGRCLDYSWRCDGSDDCGDGFDEILCGMLQIVFMSDLPFCSDTMDRSRVALNILNIIIHLSLEVKHGYSTCTLV